MCEEGGGGVEEVQAARWLAARVLDEGARVTYRELSRARQLHVATAKLLLQRFVQQQQQQHELSVSVLLCGLVEGAGGAAQLVCPLEREAERASGMRPLLYRHVYAVSRRAAHDSVSLAAAAGDFADCATCPGAVRSALCVKRSAGEIGSLKTDSYRRLEATPTSSAKPKRELDTKVTIKSNGKPDIENGASSKSPSPEKKVPASSSRNAKPQGKIANFFGNSNGQQTLKKTSVRNEVPKTVEVRKETEAVDIKIEAKAVDKQNIFSSNKVQKETNSVKNDLKKVPPNKEITKEPSKKKSTVNTKYGKVDKKRKRLVQISDSEESDSEKDDPFKEEPAPMELGDSDEDIIPATPSNNVVKITSGIINPKKRRKIVDKTYTTEDGYMITKKEEVYESCSEEEVEMKENIVETNVKKDIVIEKKQPPAPTPKKGKKKLASPQKGKQASIMSFFKKK